VRHGPLQLLAALPSISYGDLRSRAACCVCVPWAWPLFQNATLHLPVSFFSLVLACVHVLQAPAALIRPTPGPRGVEDVAVSLPLLEHVGKKIARILPRDCGDVCAYMFASVIDFPSVRNTATGLYACIRVSMLCFGHVRAEGGRLHHQWSLGMPLGVFLVCMALYGLPIYASRGC
jgi:hypothetical protein